MNNSMSSSEEDEQMNTMTCDDDLRRGPWTVEEDFALIDYIAHHGEGRWNSLASSAGLKRTGKSCRLRWLNYLRPDVRRGNITLEEQLLILELHSRWGNRWSKIAQHLPGRTDNEIKNYWRTRVQKHAKQLKCDVNSKQFKDTMRYLWMPRLVERIQAAASTTTTIAGDSSTTYALDQINTDNIGTKTELATTNDYSFNGNDQINPGDNSSTPFELSTSCYYPNYFHSQSQDLFHTNNQIGERFDAPLISPSGYFNREMDFEAMAEENKPWSGGNGVEFSDNLWNVEDTLFLEQQFNRR